MTNVTFIRNAETIAKHMDKSWVMKHIRNFFKAVTHSDEAGHYDYKILGMDLEDTDDVVGVEAGHLDRITVLQAILVARAVSFGRGAVGSKKNIAAVVHTTNELLRGVEFNEGWRYKVGGSAVIDMVYFGVLCSYAPEQLLNESSEKIDHYVCMFEKYFGKHIRKTFRNYIQQM